MAIAGNVADGVCLGSYPLDSTSNYQLWVFTDAYKATITKEKGRDIEEVEEDVYETYNLACLLTGAVTDATYKSQGVRINGVKYTLLRDLGKQTFAVKVRARARSARAPRCRPGSPPPPPAPHGGPRSRLFLARARPSITAPARLPPFVCVFVAQMEDGSTPNVTIDSVRVLKSRDAGMVIGTKGPYYFAAKYKADPRSDPSMAIAERLATGFYWAVGPDA